MADEKAPRAQSEQPRSASSRLFDLRLLIGGLFTLYGVVVGIVGLVDSGNELDKASGVRINLWMGLGMLALGLVFLAWVKLRPLNPTVPEEPESE